MGFDRFVVKAAMQHKLPHETGGQRTFVVVLETGEEIVASLQQFAERENVHTASFTAIGALSDAVLLYFDWQKKDYQKIPVRQQVEVADRTLGSCCSRNRLCSAAKSLCHRVQVGWLWRMDGPQGLPRAFREIRTAPTTLQAAGELKAKKRQGWPFQHFPVTRLWSFPANTSRSSLSSMRVLAAAA